MLEEKSVSNHKKRGNLPRAIAIYLSSLLSNEKFREIGKIFSNISNAAISKTYRKMKDRVAKNIDLAYEVNKIKDKILKYKVDA